jgi:putative phosphoribosyl transferase
MVRLQATAGQDARARHVSHGFVDRTAAGLELAAAVCKLQLTPPILVLGLPRGGVPVAYEVACALGAPLDVLVVRKVGMPGQPELALGAIASGDILVREPHSATRFDGPAGDFAELAARERVELKRREHAYRDGLPPLDLQGRSVILVDDGLATGATMLAAVESARKAGAAAIVVAAPVASDAAIELLGRAADQLVILQTPAFLHAIGEWYGNFEQVEDTQVRALLERASHAGHTETAGSNRSG